MLAGFVCFTSPSVSWLCSAVVIVWCRRDRCGFVLTPEMNKAMGGDKDTPPKVFMDLSTKALLALRQ